MGATSPKIPKMASIHAPKMSAPRGFRMPSLHTGLRMGIKSSGARMPKPSMKMGVLKSSLGKLGAKTALNNSYSSILGHMGPSKLGGSAGIGGSTTSPSSILGGSGSSTGLGSALGNSSHLAQAVNGGIV